MDEPRPHQLVLQVLLRGQGLRNARLNFRQVEEKRSRKKVGDDFQKLVIVRDEPVAHYDPDGILAMDVRDFPLGPESFERPPGV